ncbi:hypothetical protein [Kineosporia sp. R_H_3]|uniref:hypothetical protein n=1 Tax=Kineosporia sp. R_H_3 TaxID=1961848 RepID=UPI00117A69D6|nr:hypothetical protein [Kineosporia sp. R_H_3]
MHWPGTTLKDYDGPKAPTLQHTADRLEAWRVFHTQVKGYSDIAYQVAIDQAGRILVLHGLSHRSAANGDAAVNRRYGAVLLIVGAAEEPSPAMLSAFHTFYTDAWRARGGKAKILTHDRVRRMTGLGGTSRPGPAITDRIKNDTLH